MLDLVNWAADILGGTIGNLALGFIQLIVNVICTILVSCLGALAQVFLKAMSVTPTEIETWLGATLTTGSFAETITISGLLIGAMFAIWELCRGLMSFIQGENSPVRPSVIFIRFIVYGAWAYAGIKFSKIIFSIGTRIYQATESAFDSISGDFVSSVKTVLENGGTSFITLFESWGTPLATGGDVDWAVSLLGHVLTSVLLTFAMFNFLRLLFTCSQRYVNMIFYTYFSPLAIACGVSPSWSKVTWTWLKTMLSTLVLWVLDIWCVFGAYNLLQAGMSALSDMTQPETALSCLLVTYGFIKGAIAFDGIMSQFGATVTKTSGSLIGDIRDSMMAMHFAGGVAKTIGGSIAGAIGGLTGGTGPFANPLDTGKGGPQKPRNPLEAFGNMLAGSVVGGLQATSMGQGLLSAGKAVTAGVTQMPKMAKDLANEFRANKTGQKKAQFAKELGELNNKYRTDTGSGSTADNLPAPNTEAGKEYNDELQKLYDKYGEMGISPQDLANDPTVLDNMAKNTLFDPNDPKAGSMKDNGFECVGYNPGENGAGQAVFDKRDKDGNLMERREASHIGYGNVAQAAGASKALKNGMVAGNPNASKKMFSGDMNSMKFEPINGGSGYSVTGIDQNGHPIDKSIYSTRGQNLDGSQPVMVTSRNSEGTTVSQGEYTLKPGKSMQDGISAIASDKMGDAFVMRKNPETGAMEPEVKGKKEGNEIGSARATSNVYHPLSNANGPMEFSSSVMGNAVKDHDSSYYRVNASRPDKDGMLSLAAVGNDNPGTVVARGKISQSDLEAAYSNGGEAMDAAIHRAFNPPAADSGNDVSGGAAPGNSATSSHSDARGDVTGGAAHENGATNSYSDARGDTTGGNAPEAHGAIAESSPESNARMPNGNAPAPTPDVNAEAVPGSTDAVLQGGSNGPVPAPEIKAQEVQSGASGAVEVERVPDAKVDTMVTKVETDNNVNADTAQAISHETKVVEQKEIGASSEDVSSTRETNPTTTHTSTTHEESGQKTSDSKKRERFELFDTINADSESGENRSSYEESDEAADKARKAARNNKGGKNGTQGRKFRHSRYDPYQK